LRFIVRHLRVPILLACLAVAALASAGPSSAASTQVCKAPKYPGEGYFTTLTVRGVRCPTGSKLAVEYYRCRIRAGGRKGRCTSRVMNFRCTEKRNSIPTEINARVTCNRGTQRIVHTYQQNT